MIILFTTVWGEDVELVFETFNEYLSFIEFLKHFGNKPLQGLLVNTFEE